MTVSADWTHGAQRFRVRSRRAAVSGIVLAVAALLLTVCHVPGAFGAFSAKVANSSNTAGTNPYFTCGAYATDSVAGKPTFDYSFGDTPGASNPATSATIADASGNGNTGTAANVTLGVANPSPAVCPRDAATVATFNGSTSSAYGPKTAITGPNVFTIEAWFKTSTAAGKIIGFGSALTGASGNYDRHLYIGTNGLLYFGIYPGQVVTVASPNAVTDGKWHFAVATLSSAGMALYLDGTLVASNTTNTTAQSFSGYWRIGYDNTSGWVNQGSNYYFNGQLAWVGVWNSTALTAAQVKAQYAAGAPQ